MQTLETRLPLASVDGFSSPWTNPLDPFDVNGDGRVTPRDALVVVNRIAQGTNKSGAVDTGAPPILTANSFHADVNGDGSISAIDALQVINSLARRRGSPSAELTILSNSSSVVDLVFQQDFSRSVWNLDHEQASREFRFVAERGNAAIDLSSVQDESLTEVHVFDELGIEVISNSLAPNRSRFEGIKFRTVPGRVYTVTTTLNTDRADSFEFHLDVLQFDLGRWRGVVISDDPALAWANVLGADSVFGDDIHSDAAETATPLRPFERTVSVESNLDDSDDLDWYRVQTASNAMSVSLRGTAGQPVAFDVYDSDLSILDPVQTVAENGVPILATYVIPRPSETLLRVRSLGEGVGPYQLQIRDFGHVTDDEVPTETLYIPDLVGNSIENAEDMIFTTQSLTLDQRLESSDDIDVFRIPNALPGSLIATGIRGIQVDLLDSNGSVIERSDPVFNLDGVIDAAIYEENSLNGIEGDAVYVRVSSSAAAVGRYQLLFAFSGTVPVSFAGDQSIDPFAAATRADSPFGTDVHGETAETATRLRQSEPHNLISHLDHSQDIDTFYVVGRNGEVSFSMSVRSDEAMGLRLRAFDSLGNELSPGIIHQEEDVFGISFGQISVPEYTDASGIAHTRVYVSVYSDSALTGRYALVGGGGGLDRIAGIDDHDGSPEKATVLGEIITQEDTIGFLDQPNDRDAFRFTAASPELSIFLRRLSDNLALSGQGTFNLYDLEGRQIEPAAVEEELFAGWLNDRIEKRYALTVGDEYVAVVLNEDESASGRYQFRLTPVGDVLGQIETQDAPPINVTAGESVEITLSGTIEQPGQWSYHRISTVAYLMTLPASSHSAGDANDFLYDLAFYRVEDGSLVHVGTTGSVFSATLADGFLNGGEEYILGVRRPENSGSGPTEYELSVRFQGLRAFSTEDVGDTLEEALLLEPVQSPDGSTIKHFDLELDGSDDVDYFTFEAVDPTIGIVLVSFGPLFHTIAPDLFNLGEAVSVDLFDEAGNQLIPSGERLVQWHATSQMYGTAFDVVPGEQYYARFCQSLDSQMILRTFVQWTNFNFVTA
ncbi:MAG: dockerin type I domain-containing protein [Planctomycetota bacterium]